MTQPRPRRGVFAAAILLTASTVLSACGGGGGSAPTAAPATPVAPAPAPSSSSPAAGRVPSPQDAAARIAASDQRFLDIGQQDPNLIGASAWWTAEPITDGGFRITYVVGWGDCQAGCINRHQWVFEVTADGTVTLVDESGEPVP